jgi:hypothetical protein
MIQVLIRYGASVYKNQLFSAVYSCFVAVADDTDDTEGNIVARYISMHHNDSHQLCRHSALLLLRSVILFHLQDELLLLALQQAVAGSLQVVIQVLAVLLQQPLLAVALVLLLPCAAP